MNSIEFYLSALNEWKAGSPLPKPRSAFALVATHEHLYALGGWVNNECSASAQRIGGLTGTWEDVAPMQTPRRWFAAVVCTGIIYAIGGQTDSKQKSKTNTVEKYDFSEEKWVYVSSMSSERTGHAACVINGKIYVVGGLDSLKKTVKTIECFDPKIDSWSDVGNTDMNLYHHSLIVL